MKALASGITVALLSFVLFQYGDDNTLTVISSLDLTMVLFTAALMIAAFAVSGVRTFVVLRDAGLRVHWSGAAHASLMGAVGNVVLNMVGYTTARSVYLRSVGIKVADSILLSLYEKMAALAVLFALSIAGATYLFGSISLDFYGPAFLLLKIAMTVILCVVLGLIFAYGAEARVLAGRLFAVASVYSLLRVVFLTLLIHGAMLGCYVAIGRVVAPQADLFSLAAAAVVVMFAASLPISFSGWGVRELSAVHAFGIVGVSAAEALAIAVTIGALSMAVMFILTGLTTVTAPAYQKKQGANPIGERTARRPFRGDALLAVLVTLLAATLVFFNVHLPTQTGKINVNLADPVVLVGAVFALILWYRNRTVMARWRVAGVEMTMAAMTGVIIYGLLLGWASFGWFDWSFVNRGIGWGVVLAYFLTGALVAFAGGERFLRLFANCFVAAAAAVVLADYGLRIALSLGVPFELSSFASRMEGLAQNPNAFAFQLLIAFAVSVVMGNRSTPAVGRARLVLEGVLLAGLWLSASRAGFITFGVLVAGMIATGTLSWRRLVLPVAVALGLVVVISYIGSLLSLIGYPSVSAVSSAIQQMSDSPAGERMHSLTGGLAMWREHWLFGAGLGAFMRGELQANGNPLVIHSTPIWLLAEMGLVGFVAVVLPVILVARNMVSRLRFRMEPPVLAALCCLAVIAIEMQPHEMFYQRIFWLVMGAMLAMPHGVLFGGETSERRAPGVE